MDEEKVRENHSNSRPEANPGDQYSPDFGSEDSFATPDSSSGRFNVDISPNEDRSGSRKSGSSKSGSSKSGSNKSGSSKSGSNRSGSNRSGSNRSGSNSSGSNKQPDTYDPKASQIDTAAPFESVKEAVSKFGAIADWKAHRAQTNERRKFIEQELEKAHEEIPIYKQKSELAEQEKRKALKNLDGTKRLIQELKLNLERAQTEERQAKQDSELAQLRLQELEQGINDESSVAAKTQLEVAKARLQTAASELVTARTELEETQKDYEILISERDFAIEKAKEEVSAAKELEEEIENLTIQLITTKESIESIHVSHLETEEQWVQEANERDQELLTLDQELKQTEEELEKVKHEIALAEDLKSKLETASRLLHSLKDELAVYMQGKVPEEKDHEKFTRKHVQSGVAAAKKNLDEVIRDIERTTEEIVCLKTAAKSLTAQLEGEKQVLENIRKQKGLGADTVVNLESELKRARLELDEIRRKEKEARQQLVELPKQLQKASEDAEHAKLFVEGARLVLKRAKATADESKNEARSLLNQLAATEKEIEAARAQEKLALRAISALHESESARCMKTVDPKEGITITLEEYYELSKRAHDAEEAANKRVADATAQIDEAKESEMQSLNKLTQLNSEIAAQKEALNVALQKAEMAKVSKSNIEDELKRRNGETLEDVGLSPKTKHGSASDNPVVSGDLKAEDKSTAEGKSTTDDVKSGSVKGLFKKKRLFMPKFSFVFMGKKKSSSNKKS